MPFPDFRSESSRGFTLIEVLAVLVVLAVLATAVLVSQNRSNAAVISEAEQLAAHLRYTQIRALADVDPWSLTFTGGNSYRISRINGSPVRIPGEAGISRSLPEDISLAFPSAEIRFDPWGRPVSTANVPLPTNISLTLTDGTNQMTVTIAAGTGLIR
jgi:prepilin-type N-terminal cleavage/methylation domain-containing protein